MTELEPHETLTAPFPYMGGKRKVIDEVWSRFGSPVHYIEPFCGSAAMLLGSPRIASLEVVSDWNGFICNFWRSVQSDSKAVAKFADYPILHLDLGARHQWLMLQRGYLAEELRDPDWPGDAKIAGWWLWGACASIGGGWCDWDKKEVTHLDGIPYITGPGQGIHALGESHTSATLAEGSKLLARSLVQTRVLVSRVFARHSPLNPRMKC